MSSRRKKIKNFSLWKKAALAFFLISICGSFYFFLISPFFQISQIEIEGVNNPNQIKKIIQEHLKPKKFFLFSSKNLFLIPSKELRAHLLENFPEFETVILEKKWPNFFKKNPSLKKAKLKIKIKKREAQGIWCQGWPDNFLTKDKKSEEETKIQKCFYFDKTGLIYREAPLTQGNLIITVYQPKTETPQLKDQVISSSVLNFIFQIKKEIEQTLNFSVNEFLFFSEYDFRAITPENWEIRFDATQSAETQIKALNQVLTKTIPQEKRPLLEYIDLRVENRVYYKFK